jgi:hypothetical protein
MTKREFLGLLAAGSGAAALGPARAWADRIRILGEGPAPDRTMGTPQASPEFRRLVAGVLVGTRRSYGSLHVFWLHGAPPPAPLAIATLEEARARGDLAIAERPQATVPSLVVENRGKLHALLLAGEILVGGKQNRVVTEDVLLPPASGPVDLAVYCVEQGRWAGASGGFSARGTFAAPGLRAKVLERSGQQRVWAEVDRYAARLAAPSPTQSYQAVYDKAEVRAHRQAVEQAVDTRAPAGALGAAVFVAGALTGLDLFADPGLFAREWPKLLRAQALESYDRRALEDVDEAGLRARVAALLARAAGVEGTVRRGAGVGRLFEFRLERGRGAALVAEGQVVHAAVL